MNSSTLTRFSDKVLQILRANGIGIFSLSAADNRLYPQTISNGSAEIDIDAVEPIDLEAETPLAAQVWRVLRHEQHQVSDSPVNLSGYDLPPPVLMLPIIWKRDPIEEGEETMHRAVGLMMLWSKRGAKHFNADDHNLADTLSAQAAALLVEEQLAEFEDIQAAFVTVPVGLMLVGTDDRVIVANQAARHILDKPNLTGHSIAEVDYEDQLASVLDDARAGRIAQSSFVSPTGINYIANGQIANEDQIILAFSSSPISQDAEELVGQVAHELRTPLTVIQGNMQTVEALFEGPIEEEDKEIISEFITTSLIQASRMYRLIDETLNLSRIHVGKELELDITEFDLIEAIKQVYLELDDRLVRHELVSEIPDALMMEGDRGKIISIVDNFLKNACKYANPGTKITVRIVDENGTISLSVRDEGIGIPPDAIERIGKEAGFRTDISKGQAGGIGLGMVYTRRVIEGHGGQMLIESELGEGSVFTAILPKRQDD
jgi:signal transduction histidine kinase